MTEEPEALDACEEHRVFESDFYEDEPEIKSDAELLREYNREYVEFKQPVWRDIFD